jgi:cytochrome c553
MLKTLAGVICFCVLAAAQQAAGPGPRSFAERCAACHGLDAGGTEQAPSLLNFVRSHTPGEVATIIQNGIPGKATMPAFRLSDGELRQLVAHLFNLSGATGGQGGAVLSGLTSSGASGRRDSAVPRQSIPEKWQGGSVPQPSRLALRIEDYLMMPMTGVRESRRNNEALLARINFLREEPGGASRFFVNDLNGPLYIFDKKTKKLVTYLDFNGRDNRPGLFEKLTTENGFANGFINFIFDPDYRRNGKFYSLHLEETAAPGSLLPRAVSFPGLKIAGYAPTAGIPIPGPVTREAVIIEWTDSNISNSTFEGSAREVMRVQLNSFMHPMNDLSFKPAARRGDPEWRVLYIACGDSGSGEKKDATRSNPQRLDNLVGKILRIIPDPEEHKDSSSVSDNGRYRIPNDNPFINTPGARKEIWAYGLRNPYRLSWDADPSDRRDGPLIASVIGLHTWETVIIVRKGANYGYSEREGNQRLDPDNTTSPLPEVDRIPIRINDSITIGTVVPTYPVIQYGHVREGGDAVSSGFVYRGKAMPALQGKFIFGDITTGHIWYSDLKEMLAADDGDPRTMAPIHEMKILWSKGGREELYGTMAQITEATYNSRGGKTLTQAPVAGGRSDMRLASDASGELYILSKSDGMIRAVVGVVER